MRFEHVTLHLDRERFDGQLFEKTVEAGVEFAWDRVRTVEMDADRVGRCVTGSGRSFRAKWYVDASGRSRIIGRTANIGTRRWSCERIGLWCQRESPTPVGATVLHFDEVADDLAWAWEIPIAADRCSVGVVMPLTEFRAYRHEGLVIDEVFARVLDRLPHLDARQLTGPIHTRTYQPYVSQRVAGANWMLVGEAAAFVDPISSIGVTAALRHGSEAAAIIAKSGRVPESAARMLAEYDRRTRGVAVLYNEAVDGLLYRPQLRQRFGLKVAGRAYVLVGYLTNAFYTRVDPSASTGRSTTLSIVLAVSRRWVRFWRVVSHITAPTRRG
jgi:flavin-dependent dehydrogenase